MTTEDRAEGGPMQITTDMVLWLAETWDHWRWHALPAPYTGRILLPGNVLVSGVLADPRYWRRAYEIEDARYVEEIYTHPQIPRYNVDWAALWHILNQACPWSVARTDSDTYTAILHRAGRTATARGTNECTAVALAAWQWGHTP